MFFWQTTKKSSKVIPKVWGKSSKICLKSQVDPWKISKKITKNASLPAAC
jgi:hypothetical protein